MNENPKEQNEANQPQVISPQWQYNSGQLSPQAPILPEKQPVEGTFQIQHSEPTPVLPIQLEETTEQPATSLPTSPNQPIEPAPLELVPQPMQTDIPQAIPPAMPNNLIPPQPLATQQEESPQPEQNTTLSDTSEEIYSWQASEFVKNEKNGSWYLILIISAIVLCALTFFLTKELFSIIVIIVLAIAVGFYGNVKPRTLSYTIKSDGIQIGDKFYHFEEFKSFSILQDMAVPSLNLMPIKKLMMPISIYVAPIDLDKITKLLGNYLPYEERQRDFADKLSHRLRF